VQSGGQMGGAVKDLLRGCMWDPVVWEWDGTRAGVGGEHPGEIRWHGYPSGCQLWSGTCL